MNQGLRFPLIAALVAAPFLFGAKGGCGGEVVIGVDDAGSPSDTGPSKCPEGYTADSAGNCCKVRVDGTGECIGSVTDGGAPLVCTAADCGPAPFSYPAGLCGDAGTSAPTARCLPTAGKCTWQFECTPKRDCVVTGCSEPVEGPPLPKSTAFS